MTNPMKNVQRNYLKHPQHISDPYNRAHQLEQVVTFLFRKGLKNRKPKKQRWHSNSIAFQEGPFLKM